MVYVNNQKQDILILGKSPLQGLDNNTLTAEAEYSIICTEQGKKFCLSLYYNGSISYPYVDTTKIYQVKAKGLKTKLCLENISKHFPVSDMKKIGLNAYVYDFSINYFSIGTGAIQDIHKYLMSNNNFGNKEIFCLFDPTDSHS